MRVRLLGPVSVRQGETELVLGGLKQRAVFALLALNANRIVSMDRLIDEIWPDEPPARATVALRAYISRLRRVLADTDATIETKPPGWLLRIAAEQVDALRFAELVAEGRRLADADDRLELTRGRLGDALALWSGDPLADLTAWEFARVEAARLVDLHSEAGELLLEARLAAGEQAGVIESARQFVEAHPYRERAWCALILALYRNGQQSDAVATYGRLRRLLRNELGLDPSPRARELEARILRQDPELLPTRAPSIPRKAAPPAPGIEALPGGRLEGRADALAQLDAALSAAGDGIGRLLLVEASAGAGKSAILQELSRRAHSIGGRVLEGNGVGDEAIPALWPWVTIVRHLVAELPDLATGGAPSGPAALAVTTLGAGHGAELPEDAQLAQTTLYRGVVDLLLAARRAGPLTVIIDDLQWVDRDSLTLLALAVDQLAPAGVLFAVAVRCEEANVVTIGRLLTTLPRDRVTRIALAPLRPADVAELTARLAGGPVEPALVAAIADRTSGNPLFVTELVRLLVAEGQMTEQAARRALPVGVREVLQRRIDRLPRMAIVLLGVAALAGPSVLDVELLSEVTGLAEDDVLDGCDAALVSGLLVENAEAPGKFGLSHDLVRQTLVAGLSDARRVRLHAKIAAALQERTVTSPEQIVEVARQLTLAAPAVGPAAAIPYLISASEDALSRYANKSAEATLESALSVAATIADPTLRQQMSAQVSGLLGTVRTWSRGALPEPPGREVDSWLPRPTDGRSAAGWLGTVINVAASGQFAWGVNAAIEVLDASPTLSAEIAARFALGWLSYVRGDLDRAVEEFARLTAMIERGVDVALPGALFHLAESMAGYGALAAHARGDEAEAERQIAIARDRAQGSERGLVNVELYASLLAVMRGDRAAAARHAAVGDRLARSLEFPVFAIHAAVIAAWSADLGRGSAAATDQAYAAYAATGMRLFAPTFLLLRAEVHATAGDHRGAVELAQEAQRVSAEFGEVCVSPRLGALADQLLRSS